MSDKEEFRFPGEEGNTAPAAGDSGPETESAGPEEWQDEKKLRKALKKAEQKKKGASTRILLLVLLLVVLAGAGVYFFMGMPQPASPPPPPAKVVKKQPIAVPPPPAKEQAAEATAPAETAPTPGGEAVPPAEPAAETASAEEAPTGRAPAAAPENAGQPALAEEAPSGTPGPAPVAAGGYAVQAGAFMFKANLSEAMEKLTRMGFKPRVEQGNTQVVMTRLRLGAFSAEEAEAKVVELSHIVPGVFSLPSDGKVVVYAGSYYNLDRARLFADRLYRQGIRLEEETVELEVPLYQLSFGGFAGRDDAQAAAARVQEAGLDSYVVKEG